MTLEQRISAFAKLGSHINSLTENNLTQLATDVAHENPWFTSSSVRKALAGITNYLDHDKLSKWLASYPVDNLTPKTIAAVMAGNIPLVGFHDLLCVLVSDHSALVKLSTKDSCLNRYMIERLLEIEPAFKNRITVQPETLKGFDAVIATGSDNSARHFEYYFRNVPSIIRRNRTSCAILTGEETLDDLKNLGYDVFDYFGLGCRNVSKLFVPEGYNFITLLDAWQNYEYVIHHHKYANNYDYQKSILLVNQQPHLDTGFVLLQENEKLVSPISVLYYQTYRDIDSLELILHANESKLQCIVGRNVPATVSFGMAQMPEVWDYADGVDTMAFLSHLA